MSTRTTTSDFTNASDAQFRTWGQWFRDCFSAAGWTLETEVFGTGTNWTDVTAPNASNQTRVTVIFKMADALAATVPFYVKLEIGSGSSATNPGYRLTFGTGRSGTTILNILKDTGATYLSFTATTQTMTHYSSGNTGRIMISMNTSGTGWAQSTQLVLSLDRRRDSTGTALGTGFRMFYTGNSVKSSQGFTAAGIGPAARPDWYALGWSSPTVVDGLSPTPPVAIDFGCVEIGLDMLSVMASEYSVGTTLAPIVAGSAHTYIASQMTGTGIDGTSVNLRYAFRYE